MSPVSNKKKKSSVQLTSKSYYWGGVCVCLCARAYMGEGHSIYMEVRGQFVESVIFFCLYVSSRDGTQVTRLA